MKNILLSLIVAALCVVGFRGLAFTIYTVEGTAFFPVFLRGDRLVVNRWSYGLRTGSRGGLFSYGRLFAAPVAKGDIVAFDSPIDSIEGVFVCRCKAVAGDTVHVDGNTYIVPGREATCAEEDFYWMEALCGRGSLDSRAFGPVAESDIVGRVCMVLYSHDPDSPFYDGFRSDRTLLEVNN